MIIKRYIQLYCIFYSMYYLKPFQVQQLSSVVAGLKEALSIRTKWMESSPVILEASCLPLILDQWASLFFLELVAWQEILHTLVFWTCVIQKREKLLLSQVEPKMIKGVPNKTVNFVIICRWLNGDYVNKKDQNESSGDQ